jgi:hypothetical protein
MAVCFFLHCLIQGVGELLNIKWLELARGMFSFVLFPHCFELAAEI